MKKKEKKAIFNAGLDKVGFIEAQGLPWVLCFIASGPEGAAGKSGNVSGAPRHRGPFQGPAIKTKKPRVNPGLGFPGPFGPSPSGRAPSGRAPSGRATSGQALSGQAPSGALIILNFLSFAPFNPGLRIPGPLGQRPQSKLLHCPGALILACRNP